MGGVSTAGWGVAAGDAGIVGYGAQANVHLIPPNGSVTVDRRGIGTPLVG